MPPLLSVIPVAIKTMLATAKRNLEYRVLVTQREHPDNQSDQGEDQLEGMFMKVTLPAFIGDSSSCI